MLLKDLSEMVFPRSHLNAPWIGPCNYSKKKLTNKYIKIRNVQLD